MRRWYIAGALLLATVGMPDRSDAADAVEYRTVTMVDGSVHLGVVVSSDAESLHLKTLKGEKVLPIIDVVGIETISREAYLTREGRRLLYLGVRSDPSLTQKSGQIDAIMLEALKREDLLVISPSALSAPRREQLEACTDLPCKLEVLRAEGVFAIFGELERKDGQDRVTFRRFDRAGDQVGEVSLSIDVPKLEQNRLARTAALVLGEKATSEPESVATAAAPLPAEDHSPEDRPVESTPGDTPPGEPTAVTTNVVPPADTPSTSVTHGVTELDLARVRRIDLIPIPGASSLFHYDKVPQAVVATGVVAAVTGAAVFITGDMRMLGADDGLPVPWTHEERGFRDAALLTGVGAVSYLASTWIVNQVLGRINRHHDGQLQSSR